MFGPRGGRLAALDPGDGADRGRRIEAGDDRRDAGALAPRLPGVPLGAGSAAVARRGGAVLGFPEPGDPDQGPGRTGLDRGRHRSWPGGGAGRPRPGNGCTGGGDSIGFAILTAPWFVAISIASAGEFLRFAVGRQIVHRLASDMEAHGGFPGYYPVVSALVFYPWSALVPAALAGAWMRRKSDPNLGFLLGWAIGPLLLLECFRTKLIHYYLPAFPACALLTAWLVLSVTAEGVNIRRRPLGRLAMALLVGIGLAGIVLLVAGTTLVPGALRLPHAPGRRWSCGRHARRHVGLSARSDRAGGLLSGRDLGGRDAPATGWLIPLGEPYRTSRVIGEKLAAFPPS